MHKRAQLIAVAVLASLCLGGCTRQSADGNSAQIVLPDPPAYTGGEILGDASQALFGTTFLYPSGDGHSLNGVMRTIVPKNGSSYAESIAEAFFERGAGETGVSSVIRDVRLLGVEESCGSIVVDLSTEARTNRTDAEFISLCAALSDTLLASGYVDTAAILINGFAPSAAGLPLGVFTEEIVNPSADYAQRQAESERISGTLDGTAERTCLLYYPSADGNLLLPETRVVDVRSASAAGTVLEALSQPPQKRTCCVGALPASLDLFETPPTQAVTASGEAIIELRFAPSFANYVALAGIEPWQVYGSAVLSICSFVPDIAGVRIFVDGQPLTACTIGTQTVRFKDGIARRSDFTAQIGSSAMLTLAGASGLESREYALSRAEASSAVGILSALLRLDNGVLFPAGIRSSDFLGASLDDGLLTVNMSGSFYTKCQALTPAGERSLIYAMINTLCTLPQVSTVRFIVEGRQVDTLAGEISLLSPLLPDLLIQDHAETDSGDAIE